MTMNTEINSTLELPYKLIDIGDSAEQFTLCFKSFDQARSAHSIQTSGVSGVFEVEYKCSGIDCRFECDMTVGNLFYFYTELENVYECLPGIEPVAFLNNYGADMHTDMSLRFDKKGHFNVIGHFKNKQNNYKSSIAFDIQADTAFVYDILGSLKAFFDELKRIQGHGNFY